ncbi:structural maintenance of chromosomes protein 2-2-like [Teleopsis dalmanni]|uniref:structural maintenance of chromosomes protein 2-2-like n=1 Tax=Teleopsis dalmanni TaxID=139649 RepID=UPI0018CEF8B1|nr:structural maintenance of chromosomes protein 2-2-like [Teleopsis dalmanni]
MLECPLGFENCSEISVTRQIVVAVFYFCSVDLDVNNPNFLIMQGRITKVLNMKPKEILSMIEEAAGTSLYDSKRDATNKLLEEKDLMVRGANQLLDKAVESKLEK